MKEIPHIIKYEETSENILRHWFLPWKNEEEREEVIKKEGLDMIEEFGRSPLPTEYGDFTYIVYGDMRTGQHHNVLVFGNIANGSIGDGENILVRVHSACWTNEVARAINCECRKEIEQTFKLIQQEGKGIFIYLDQEGRGAGIAGKIAQLNGMFEWTSNGIDQQRNKEGNRIDTDMAYKEAGYPSESRNFEVAGDILQRLGVKSVRLLTNNPIKIKGIESVGIKVESINIHIKPDNLIIAADLKSKAKNLNHNIPETKYIYSD